jgi:hypothetical protein
VFTSPDLYASSRRVVLDPGTSPAALPESDEGPPETRGRDAPVLDGRQQDEARLTLLMEALPELGQLLCVWADTDGAELAPHRALIGDRAVADYDVALGVLQLQPEHPVAAEDRQRVETPAESCAQMIDVLVERGAQDQPPPVVVFGLHTHSAGDRDFAVKQLLNLPSTVHGLVNPKHLFTDC